MSIITKNSSEPENTLQTNYNTELFFWEEPEEIKSDDFEEYSFYRNLIAEGRN